MMREKVLGRPWQYPLSLDNLLTFGKDMTKIKLISLEDRQAMGYRLHIDMWQSGTTRVIGRRSSVEGLSI